MSGKLLEFLFKMDGKRPLCASHFEKGVREKHVCSCAAASHTIGILPRKILTAHKYANCSDDFQVLAGQQDTLAKVLIKIWHIFDIETRDFSDHILGTLTTYSCS